MNSETCTCRYKHCSHSSNKLLKSEAVRVGSCYYHKDCYETKKAIADIIDYFVKEVNPDVVYPVLVRTINNICFPKDNNGIPAERLLFQIKHYCTHGHNLRYPGGLYYVLQDRDSFEAYKKYKAEQALKEKDLSFRVSDEQNRSREGHVTIKKQKSFEDILKVR